MLLEIPGVQELRSFQTEVVEFGKDPRSVLIGDDMGLGKTVSAIALDEEKRKKAGQKVRTLVVCPLSMVGAWTNHFRKWTDLAVYPINNKDRATFLEAVETGLYDVYICHWPALRLMPELAKYPWYHVIADECHALQNRKSKQSIALKKIKAMYKTGLTGTPVWNHPDDLWSILNWMYPKFWSSYWRFYNRYVNWVDYNGYKTIVGVQNEDELRKQIAPFFIRRRKEDVLKELPDKYYTTIEVELDPKQRKLYDSMKKDMIAWVGEQEEDGQPINAPVVIAQLTRLRQFACAAADIDKETGQVRLTDPSTKLDALMELIQNTNDPIVVFSTSSQMIYLLQSRLEKQGISHGIYTGDVSKSDRDAVVDNFQAGKLQVFAGTISAGGVGITLTRASTEVFIDRDWVQALNLQAEDRCHRIGQKNAVQIIDIVSKDTLDAERIDGIKMNWAVIKQLLGEL